MLEWFLCMYTPLQKPMKHKLHKDVATQCKINYCKNKFTTVKAQITNQ